MIRQPTPEVLRQLLRYDPETGRLFWLPRDESLLPPTKPGSRKMGVKEWNARYAGKEAFTAKDSNGYKVGAVNGVTLLAHRVAVAIVTGDWPEVTDHENGNTGDNHFDNLKSGTVLSNQRNTKRHKTNTSGATGVGRSFNGSRWRARIWDGKKQIALGVFDTFEEAVAARKHAEGRLGYHRNHGRHA